MDVATLLDQSFVDQVRLAANIRSVVPPRSSALLSDIVALFPLEHGAAEIIGYLALTDDDLEVAMDEADETLIEYAEGDVVRRARLPKVTVTRQ